VSGYVIGVYMTRMAVVAGQWALHRDHEERAAQQILVPGLNASCSVSRTEPRDWLTICGVSTDDGPKVLSSELTMCPG
jgi:hypothetical protein